jgi:hypothetical protein
LNLTSLRGRWMPAPIFFAADFKFLIEHARRRGDDIATYDLMPIQKVEHEYHYFRVVVTYSDGETSGHRIFKDRKKTEK